MAKQIEGLEEYEMVMSLLRRMSKEIGDLLCNIDASNIANKNELQQGVIIEISTIGLRTDYAIKWLNTKRA